MQAVKCSVPLVVLTDLRTPSHDGFCQDQLRAHGNPLYLYQNPPKSPWLKQSPGATGENWVWFRCTLLILPKPVTSLAQGWTCIELHNPFALSAFQTMAKALTDVFQQFFFFFL